MCPSPRFLRSSWSVAPPVCPAVSELVKELTGREPNKGVNPDEVVAVGAALQAGVIQGAVRTFC